MARGVEEGRWRWQQRCGKTTINGRNENATVFPLKTHWPVLGDGGTGKVCGRGFDGGDGDDDSGKRWEMISRFVLCGWMAPF